MNPAIYPNSVKYRILLRPFQMYLLQFELGMIECVLAPTKVNKVQGVKINPWEAKKLKPGFSIPDLFEQLFHI